jgi:hypothetical protein
MRRLLLALLALAAIVTGCGTYAPPKNPGGAPNNNPNGNGSGAAGSTPSTIQPPIIPADAFATLKPTVFAHAELCVNDGAHPNFPNDADLITKTYCQDLVPGGAAATPHSLADLQKQLGLDFKNRNGGNGVGGNPGFALLGHSSALTARKISAITPTTFVFTPPPLDGSKPSGFVFLAFDPGEQFVEVASHDPTADKVNFYLVLFEQACTQSPSGCTPTDLLTPKLTTGWTSTRVYESGTDLNNTIADCRQCHEPNHNDPQFLRMQEIEPPFTHWFSSQTDGGRALLADFHAAHGANEDYGGIPATLIDKSDPSLFAKMVTAAGFATQPNAFPSAAIEAEVKAAAAGQPAVNVPPGKSATWDLIYGASQVGQFIAAPYHDVKVTDANKLQQMTAVYQQWQAGRVSTIPDIRDVFLDSGLREMGFAPKFGLSGRALLVQMCQQCHNANLDPTITRDRFLVDQLDQMSRDEKDLAIARLGYSTDTRLVMPPPLFRTLTNDERQAMIDELKK